MEKIYLTRTKALKEAARLGMAVKRIETIKIHKTFDNRKDCYGELLRDDKGQRLVIREYPVKVYSYKLISFED